MTNSLAAVKDILGFAFRDPKWQSKFLVGSGLIFAGWLFPILPWLPVMGYGARIVRRAARDEAAGGLNGDSLPNWDDWGDLMLDGLRQFGVSLILTLPVMLLMMIGYGMYFGSTMLLALEGGEPGPFFVFSFLVLWLTIGFSIVFSLVTFMLLAPAQAHVAVKRDFSAFLRPGEWLGSLRRNLFGYFVVLFLLLGFYALSMFILQLLYITFVLCCLIPLIFSLLAFYTVIIYYHTAGLAYGETQPPAADRLNRDSPPGPAIDAGI